MMFRDRFQRWRNAKARTEANPPPPEPVVAVPIRPEDYVGEDQTRNEQVVREKFASKAKRYLRAIPLASEVVAMYFCMLDPRTPIWVKGTAAAALAYFIMPFDAIADVIPLIGMSDDAAVLTAALTAISTHITDEHRHKARQWMEAEEIQAGVEPQGSA